MLLSCENSCLLLIDVQEKLLPAVADHALLLHNCEWLLQLAQALAVPIAVSEQYPQGLGPLVATLKQHLSQATRFLQKTHFACTQEPGAFAALEALGREQYVLVGIETHVCVLQTALDLSNRGKEVFVVADAVGSRAAQDKQIALARLQAWGVQIVTKEMVFFEWLRDAAHAQFKTLSQRFMKG